MSVFRVYINILVTRGMNNKSISVVLPVYNEEGNIYEVVREITDFLPSVTIDFEIIAVNDGSIDRTSDILEELSSTDSRVKVIQHKKNKGYGAALISGLEKAGKELILIMDADRQFNIFELKGFIPYIEDFDIVAGFRIKRKDPFPRYLLGVCFNLMSKILFRTNTKDINCGFKLFKGELLHNINLTMEGALINVEFMALLRRTKARIKEVGVNHYPRFFGKQTGGSLKIIREAFLSIFLLMRRLWLEN